MTAPEMTLERWTEAVVADPLFLVAYADWLEERAEDDLDRLNATLIRDQLDYFVGSMLDAAAHEQEAYLGGHRRSLPVYLQVISDCGRGFWLFLDDWQESQTKLVFVHPAAELLARAAFGNPDGKLHPAYRWFEAATGCRRTLVQRDAGVPRISVNFKLPEDRR